MKILANLFCVPLKNVLYYLSISGEWPAMLLNKLVYKQIFFSRNV